LDAAVRLGLHAVVLDNEEEVQRLEGICQQLGASIRVMVRLALSLEVETHPHLQTSGRGSKFGIFHPSEAERGVWDALSRSKVLRFAGLHTHLGSQISDISIPARAAAELLSVARSLEHRGLESEEISVGGGWAVPYTPGETALSPETVARALGPVFESSPGFKLAVEPGRALVARSGVAVYRIGSVKVSDERRIISVDGGMGDNPRPALYGARYSVLRAASPFAPAVGPADVVGRYCESGDILARDVPLPQVAAGDLLCVPVSGAYQLSMASAYNLVPQPAAVLVANGQSRLITRRATVEDVLSREILEGP
jgi:diaminopimelate decarboxylase